MTTYSEFLASLGWNAHFENAFAAYATQGCAAGRVASEAQHIYRLYTPQGEVLARVSGKLRFGARSREDFPAVGDWVAASIRPEEGEATIHAVLPRLSKFSRKVAGETTEEQVVAANVDTIFLVSALNHDFNLRRLERYLVMAWESGANPVILLNKADLCDDVEGRTAEVASMAIGVPVHVVSCATSCGLAALAPHLSAGSTVALLGSSGVGKSTLVNRLIGRDIQEVRDVREGDDRGRHTTTRRELIRLPQGGLVIDTPGMRELQLWGAEEGFQDAFEDIGLLARECRFRDCQHVNEPGCAVLAALDAGALKPGRYDNYRKLQRELAYLARKEDQAAQSAEKEKWKRIHKALRVKGHK